MDWRVGFVAVTAAGTELASRDAREHRDRRLRQARRDLPRAGLARRRGARPARGRAGHREDRARPRDRPDDRGRDGGADPVHARPAADRRHRALDLQPEDARLRVPARPGLRERPARRRDQPRDAEDPVGPARGDGRAPGHGRRSDPAAPAPVLRDRDREPDRAGGHLPPPRGAARPIRGACHPRLSRRRGGGGGRARAAPRPSARQARARGRAATTCASCSGRSRRSTWTTCCCGGSSTWCARPARWRGSRPAPRCAAASRSSGRRGRGRSCTGASTWCPRTSRRSSSPVLGHRILVTTAFLAETRGLGRDAALERIRGRAFELAPRPEPDWHEGRPVAVA